MRWGWLFVLAACSFQHGAASQLTIDDAPVDGASPDVSRAWWNPAWRVRMPIAIGNPSTGALAAGYQIGLRFDAFAAPCTTNRDDLRIVYGTTELARVIDEVGPPEWTWFPLAAPLAAGTTSTGEYWLYCGNPAPAAAPADPAQVFDFYDGFDEAVLDLSVWTKQNMAVLGNGQLTCGGGANNDSGIVTTTPTFHAHHAVDFVATASTATNAGFWAGFQLGTMDVQPWLHWWTQSLNAIRPDFQATNTSTLWLGANITLDLSPHFYGVENYGTSSMYRYDDEPRDTHVYDVSPPDPLSVRLWEGDKASTVKYDLVRVRQAVDPAPTATVGAAENY